MRFAAFSPVMCDAVYQLDAWFAGRVQGVGFRARVLQVARGFEVTGRVQNLDDGRVHLFAEGAQKEVNDFVDAVADSMPAYIRGVETRPSSGARRHVDFLIRD